MTGPTTLGGILNEVMFARVAFGEDGSEVRSALVQEMQRGPQDERSMSQRLESAIAQKKITSALASKMYENEATINRQDIDPRHSTILRHLLRNIASGSTGSVRDKVDAAIFAHELGYELQTTPEGRMPGYDWSGSASKRPLIDLMARAERQNLDLFVRAVVLGERSLMSGNNEDRSRLPAMLEQDGFPLTGAVARFASGIGVPSRRAAGDQLPQEIRRALTILYADALARGTVNEFREYVSDLERVSREQGIDIKSAIAAATAEYRATIELHRGGGRGINPPAGSVEAAANLAKHTVQFIEEGKAIGRAGDAKIAMANYYQDAAKFVRPAAEAPVEQGQGMAPQAQPADNEAVLREFYSALSSPEEIERLKNDYFAQQRHISTLPKTYAPRAALVEQNNIIGERLMRLKALQDALANKPIAGRRQNVAAAVAENRRRIEEARATGASVVILKDPTRWDANKNFIEQPWPLSAVAQAAGAPPQQPLPQPSHQDAASQILEQNIARPASDELVEQWRQQMLAWAPEFGAELAKLDQQKKREAAGRLANRMVTNAKVGAVSHGIIRDVLTDLRKAMTAESFLVDDPITQLAMPPAIKKSDLTIALKSMGSSVTADQILGIGPTIKKDVKEAMIKALPNDAKLAEYVAKTSVIPGKPSSAAGFNATELYYVISKISSVKFASTEQKSSSGMAKGQRGAAEEKAKEQAKPADPTGSIEDALFGERVSPLGSVIKSIPVPAAGEDEEALVTATEWFMIANAGSLMPAETIRLLDGDSVVMGVCGEGDDGAKYCVRMHVRMAAGVSAKEKDETATETLHQKLKQMVDVSVMVNPSNPVAAYDRWAGIIYGEDKNGKIHKVNIELKELGAAGKGGYDRRYGTKYDEYGPEPSDASIMESLGGGGNRDPLFGETNVYEGVAHERPAAKTELQRLPSRSLTRGKDYLEGN